MSIPNYISVWANSVTSFSAADMNAPLYELDAEIAYFRNLIIHTAGTIDWNSSTGTLTWSADIDLIFTKSDGAVIKNTISASSQVIADNQILFVDLVETQAEVITVDVEDITFSVASNICPSGRVVLAYKNATSNELFFVKLNAKSINQILDKLDATVEPTVNDDSGEGYSVGSIWIDVTADNSYICVDSTEGAAVWNKTNSLLDKLDATVEPTVNDDSSAGYSVGSIWIDVTADNSYICVDSTVGAAVWNKTNSLLDKLDAEVAPTANDDSGEGYSVGSIWIDVTADNSYICVDSTVGAAVWNQTNNVETGLPAPSVITPSDGATITIDCSAGDVFKFTLTQDSEITFSNPVEQKPILLVINPVTYTPTWNAVVRFSDDVPSPTLTASTKNYIGFRYNSEDSKHDCMAVNKGF